MEPATCVECGGLYEKLCKTHLTCSSECLIKRSTRRQQVRKNPERYATKPCLECGKLFTPVYGEYSKGRCSLECKAKAKARNVKKGRRVQKAKRRAVERGAEADSIDPIKIFERDRWRCQLCGRNTPKALRGKNQPASPELDHIVPLSRGGPHTYANTQCACRECNGNKGATIMGQLNFNL
jgi:5-methylcytosine-specific restriction endonuclease McrA